MSEIEGSELLNANAEIPDNSLEAPDNAPLGDADGGSGEALPALNSFIGDDGVFKEGWREEFVKRGAIPEAFAKDQVYAAVKDLPSLMKQLGHQSKLIGKQGKGVDAWKPGEHASQEEWDIYYTALGRPAVAADYKADPPEALKELYDDTTLQPALEALHKAGLTQKQVDAVMALEYQRTEKALADQQTATETAIELAEKTLRDEWGNDFESNNAIATRLVRTVIPAEMQDEFKAAALQSPVLIKALVELGKATLEDSPINTDGQPQTHSVDEEIASLEATKGYATGELKRDNRAEYDRIQARRALLYRKKYPEQK